VVVVVLVLAAILLPNPVSRVAHGLSTQQCFERPHDGGVVALGDSITRGQGDPAWGFQGRTSWFSFATCDGPVRYGYNAGINGNTTEQMAARFDEDVVAHRPTTVVLLGGTNDLVRRVPTATIVDRLLAMADRSRAHGATPVLATVPPIDFPGLEDAAEVLDDAIRRAARDRQLQLIDFYAAVAEGGRWRPGWSPDGIHPTGPAARAMARQAVAVLQSAPSAASSAAGPARRTS
jgi:lysophospholipase L1-like esterase